MATGWSDYQQTQGYIGWFYYVKFAVVSLISLGFASFCIFRVIAALKPPAPLPRKTSPAQPQGTQAGDDSNPDH